MRVLLGVLLAASLLVGSGCATLNQARPKPPTPDEIVQLSQEGKSAQEIIKLMKESRAVYEMSASKLAELHQRGVAAEVIDYMQATYLEQARWEEALRRPYYGPWGYWGPPHPRYYYRHWHRWPYWDPYW